MKLFTFILSIYISAVAIMSCQDRSKMNAFWEADKDGVKSEFVLDQQGHNDTENSQDECGPFCSCVCCGTVLIIPLGEQIGKALITLPSSYIFSYEFNYSFEYSEGVWHPPICV